MSTDFSKPLVTDAYATLLPGIQAAINDLVRGLDPTLTGTSTNIPVGAKRINETTGWIERFNGTSWVIYSMTGVFSSLSSSGGITSGASGGSDGIYTLKLASDGVTVGSISADSANSQMSVLTLLLGR